MEPGEDYLSELATRPGAAAPATLGEIWRAEWNGAGLDTITGLGAPVMKAYEDLRQAVEGAAGKPIGDAAAERGINFFHARGVDARAAALGAIADTLPEDQRKDIEPLRDIRARAADAAAAIERERGDTANGTYGLSGHATAFLAGVARQAVDPVNLGITIATAPMGGEGALLPYLARQAAIGAGTQAVQEPAIQGKREQLALQTGLGEATRNILMAGAGAAGISGLFRAAGYAARLYSRRGAKAAADPIAPTAAPPSDTFTGFLEPEDAAALDRGEHIDFREVQPLSAPAGYGGDFTIPTNLGPTREKLPAPAPVAAEGEHGAFPGAEHAAAIDRGAPIDYREAHALGDEIGGEHGYGGNFDFAPKDFEAAAMLAERDQVIGHMAPDHSGAGRQAHDVLLGDADAIINQGHEFRPLFDVAAIERISQAASARDRAAQLDAVLKDLPKGDAAAAETLARLQEVDRQLAAPEISKADHKKLSDRRDELLANTNPEALQAAAAPIERRRVLAAERANPAIRIAEIDKETANARLEFATAHKPAEKPAAKPAASGMRAPEGESMPIGNRQLAADAERAMAAHGDMAMEVENPDGTVRRVTARALLAEAEEDAAAARELVDCLGGIAENVL